MIQKKICLIGAPSVGKTSLVARYIHSLFSEKYLSTVGVKVDKKIVQVQGRDVTLMVWDLAGDDEFQPLKASYLRGASGYLLVADGSRVSSFNHALDLQDELTRLGGPLPFVLVLNKSDLTHLWEVPESRIAELLAKGWNVRRTSAKEGTGVEEAFALLAEKVLGPTN